MADELSEEDQLAIEQTSEPSWTASRTCEVCTSLSKPRSSLCERCWGILNRRDPRGWSKNKTARRPAMKARWDEHRSVFTCHFTGLTLSDDPNSPLYGTWEHLSPGNTSDVTLAAAIINNMKSSMSEGEFRAVVLELSRQFEDPAHEFNEGVIPEGPWRGPPSIPVVT